MLTRFAPAPTGLLHLGHVANALAVWGLAAAEGGRVLLRIEDHDRQRATRPFERQLLDDLDWLGFVPDIYPTAAYRAGACDGRQSDCEAIYIAAARELIDRGVVYGCTCSRRDILRRGPSSAGEARYPGTCRHRGIAPGPDVGWRLRIDPGTETFVDLWQGTVEQDPGADGGDLLIRDRHGNWTYQFAVVVDDWRQRVDTVVRGADLLASTGRQIRLARLLGREVPPRFAHHALIMRSAAAKLSKSDGDTGIRALADAGWTPAEVIGEAAARAGWIAGRQPIPAHMAGGLVAALGKDVGRHGPR